LGSGRKYPGRFVLQKELSERKQTEERSWLREVSSAALQAVIRQADWAMQNLFQKRGKYPRFKKRSQRQSVIFNRCSSSLKPAGGVYLAKIGIVYPIWSRPLPSEYILVTVIKDCADRYFLSLVVKVEPEQMPAQEPSVLNPEASRPALEQPTPWIDEANRFSQSDSTVRF